MTGRIRRQRLFGPSDFIRRARLDYTPSYIGNHTSGFSGSGMFHRRTRSVTMSWFTTITPLWKLKGRVRSFCCVSLADSTAKLMYRHNLLSFVELATEMMDREEM